MRTIYADNNSTTRMPDEVLKAMLPYLTDCFENPSSPSQRAQQASSAVESARETISKYLGVLDTRELIFTSGATESNNWVFYGAIKAAPDKKHLITTQTEHPAVREVGLDLEAHGFKVTWLPVEQNGCICLDSLKAAITQDTLLVSIMHANNETGVIQPIKAASDLTKNINASTLFHSDASQTVGKLPIDLGHELENVDLLTFSGHKMHGPKGIGGLFIRKGTTFKPMLLGGRHEHGLRAGTENVPCIVGLATAFELLANKSSRAGEVRNRLQALIEKDLPEIEIIGRKSSRLDNTLCILVKSNDSDLMLNLLEQDGIIASNGSACSTGSLKPSHVLTAMGYTYKHANGMIRFSFSRYNRPEDAERIFESLRKAFVFVDT